MTKALVIILCMLLFACYDRKKEAIDKAIRAKENNKDHHLDSYFILRTVDTLGTLKVYYQAQLNTGTHLSEVQDSITFYTTGDGILQPQP